MSKRRGNLDWKTRRKVFEKTGGKCAYCGKQLSMEELSYEEAQGCLMLKYPWPIDHIIPVCKGGSNQIENLAPSCNKCNSSKSGKKLEEWRA